MMRIYQKRKMNKGKNMVKKNGMNTKIDVAVIKTDLNWIKDKLISIEDNVKTTKSCVDTHEDRIIKLESGEQYQKEGKEMSRKDLVIVLSVITVFINIVLWVVEKFVL